MSRVRFPLPALSLRAPGRRAARCRWGWSVAAVALLGGHPQYSAAQDPHQSLLGVAPDSLVLSDRAPTASLTLTNLQDVPREVWLAPECPAGDYAMMNAQLFYSWVTPQPDPSTAAWRNASSCAVAWVTGYPRHLTLAPHERRTIPVQIDPPNTLQNGRYGMRLIWAVRDQGPMVSWITHYEVPIIYVRGLWHQRRWQPTPATGRGSGMIQATPAAVVLDDSVRAATFTLYNRAARPTAVWLAVDCPWFTVNFAAFPLSHQYEASWHGRTPNASLVIGGFPQHLVLAPHERRTLPIQFAPGPVGILGTAYARVVYVEAPVLLVSPTGDTTFTTPGGAVNVVLRKRVRTATKQLVWPSLTLSQPWLEESDASRAGNDSQRVVCDTLRQPGLGFVATLHAEVDDTMGRPVASHSPASPGSGGPPAWGLDTTVTVWQTKHSQLMQLDDGGDILPPSPVCVTLPRVAPGHYQVVLTAYQLQDPTHQHPVRATLPVEVP